MDYTVQINLPDHKLGDEWVGILSIAPSSVTGLTMGQLTRVRMNFVKGALVFMLDSSVTLNPSRNAPITITDDTQPTWVCTVPSVVNFLPEAGVWNWDMQFTHTGTITPVTLYKGSLTVHDDVTK